LEIHSSSTKIFTRKPGYHLTAIHGIKLTTSASTTDGDRHCHRRPSISWCRCEHRPLSAGGQDQAQVEKESQEETISSVCSAKLKDPQTSRKYELELSNRFTVLQDDLSIEEKWELFSTSVKASAETVIGCKRGTNREHWISDRTWNLIDDRKEAKKKKDQAFTRARAQAETVNYQKLYKEVKKSCKQDKKD